METSGNNTRGSTCVLLSIIYRSVPSILLCLPFGITIRRYIGIFSTVKNPPCRGGTVRCFFLDGKCRRHKCLFDLMTRCYTRSWTSTYTFIHASTFYLPWGPSVAIRPHVALLSPSKKERAKFYIPRAKELYYYQLESLHISIYRSVRLCPCKLWIV